MHRGCLRPLLISAGIIGFFTIGLMGVYRDTFALMWENMTTMGEGREIASQMRGPDDLLAYMAAHPERVSLVAFDVEDPDGGIRYGGDSVHPVVGLPRLLVLAEYARAVEAGEIDPDARVPVDAISRLALPGTDGGNHGRARAGLFAEGVADADSTVTLDQVAEAMVRWSDNASMDLLVQRLDRAALDALPVSLGYPSLQAPLPQNGLYLSWNNHMLASPPEERLRDIQAIPEHEYDREVHALAERYRSDAAFRQGEIERLERKGTDLSLRQQRALAHATFPLGTAEAYAQLVGRALRDSLLSPEVSDRLTALLDRPVPDSAGVRLDVIGSAGGSFPGMVSVIGYARRADRSRVVAMLMEDVPFSVFYHLMQTGLDKGLVVQLLGDDAFFQRVRSRLGAVAP